MSEIWLPEMEYHPPTDSLRQLDSILSIVSQVSSKLYLETQPATAVLKVLKNSSLRVDG